MNETSLLIHNRHAKGYRPPRKKRGLLIGCLCLLFLILLPSLTVMASQEKPKALGVPIALGQKISVTVTRENAEKWRLRFPTELHEAKGTLVAFTFRFKAKEVEALGFATDYSDASRSDIAFMCGTQALNPFTSSRPKRNPDDPYGAPVKDAFEFGRLGAFRDKTGREGSILVGTDFSLTVYFDLPAACSDQKQLLSLTFDTDGGKHTFTLDIAPGRVRGHSNSAIRAIGAPAPRKR